jgi:hypothetical protein
MAVRALAAWGAARWTADVREALASAASREPNAKTAESLARVLSGGPYDSNADAET